jgi:hypothetical protein
MRLIIGTSPRASGAQGAGDCTRHIGWEIGKLGIRSCNKHSEVYMSIQFITPAAEFCYMT